MNSFFKRYIRNPILRLYNRIFRNYYVYDNPVNQQRIDYLQKVIDNPEYQPSTPLEHFVEHKTMTLWMEQDPDYRTEFLWNLIRPFYFQRIIDYIDQFPRVKD